MKKQKSASFWVAIALILCLISSLGASMVQTGGGAIKYHDITMVTDSGHELDALLLVPKNATRENPAPAIVTSHGWYNNREMQDLNYVEYARRGYVVISISMYGHGDSEVIPDGTWWDAENNANGLYDAVKYIARLPYVDASRIGVTGHSNGALASRVAVMQDEEGLIAAALLVSNDAVYKKDDQWVNIFGSRDAGIVACQYDEFFHRVKQEDGTKSAPRDYIDQNTAQSFLHFGVDPTGLDKRSADTYYTEQIDGKDAFDHLFGAWYDADAAAFKGTDREVCSSIWEEYRTFSNPSLNPDAEAINAEAKLKMEAKQLAPYEEYIHNHGLTWPVREVDGKWLPTLWRFCDGPQEDGFDEYGVETYGEHDKAGGVSFYKSADKKPSAVFRPYEPPAEEPSDEYPFWFCTGRLLEHWHTGSMTRRVPELNRALPEALLDMNPADCEKLGVTDGDRVRLTSRFGTCDITVSTAGRTRPPAGMVFAPFFAEETLINLVVQDTYCPLSKEPDFKKTCVSIEKI